MGEGRDARGAPLPHALADRGDAAHHPCLAAVGAGRAGREQPANPGTFGPCLEEARFRREAGAGGGRRADARHHLHPG
eukprot:8848264-Alexandrium_andersonii.AAC.1